MNSKDVRQTEIATPTVILKQIKVRTCPECHAEMSSASWDGTHCNGQQFETVEFRCGKKMRYVPNFSHIETTAPCRHTDEYAKREEKRRAACIATETFIMSLNVDEDYKRSLMSYGLSYKSEYKSQIGI